MHRATYVKPLLALLLVLGAIRLATGTALADPLGVEVSADCDGNVYVTLTNQSYWVGHTLTAFVTYQGGQQATQPIEITEDANYTRSFDTREGTIVAAGVADYGGVDLSYCYVPPTEVPPPPPTEVPPPPPTEVPTEVPTTPDLGVEVSADCDGNVNVTLTNQDYWVGHYLTVFVTYQGGQQSTQRLDITSAANYYFQFSTRGGTLVAAGVADYGGVDLSGCSNGEQPRPQPTEVPQPQPTQKPGGGEITTLPNTGSGEEDSGNNWYGAIALVLVIAAVALALGSRGNRRNGS